MCRLFASVSAAPRSARDLLADAEFSLLRQTDGDPTNPQKDGWGLAWFGPDGRARVVKSGRSARDEAERFTRAADDAVSRVVIGHLRAATNPHLDEAHAHPFQDGAWVFAHNGTLTIQREVAEALGPRRARLKTDSDSEVYFQQFLKHLDASGDPSLAFEACVAEDWRLWESCRDRYPEAATPYTSLNAVASDGRALHALCHASRAGGGVRGVFHAGLPWSVMCWAERDGRLILASEGVDAGDWNRLSPPETISVAPEGDRVALRRRALAADAPSGPIPEVSRA
jgi:predicted glutamine amidotransferase